MGMNVIPHQEDSSTGKLVRQKSTGGASHVIDPPLAGVIDDQGAGTVYIAEAPIGTATTASAWRVKRLVTASGRTVTTWAASGAFSNACNSTAVLAALSYT